VYGTGSSAFVNPLEVEVRHGSYNALDLIADHIKSSKKIIGAQIGRGSGDKRPNETYFKEDRAFVHAVLNGDKPLVSGEDGLRVLEVLEAVKESLEDGKNIEVKKHEI